MLPGGWSLQQIVEESMALLMQRLGTFAYYDADDLRQEIAIIILNASDKFDASKVKNCSKQYYFTCVSNRLRNLHRDKNSKIVDVAQGGNIYDLDEDLHPTDTATHNNIMTNDLFSYVTARIPPSLMADFQQMMKSGGEGVTPYKKGKIRIHVRLLIKRYNG